MQVLLRYLSGNSSLSRLKSLSMTSSGRSLMSSMFSQPMTSFFPLLDFNRA